MLYHAVCVIVKSVCVISKNDTVISIIAIIIQKVIDTRAFLFYTCISKRKRGGAHMQHEHYLAEVGLRPEDILSEDERAERIIGELAYYLAAEEA
jgi:hypothetical protein